jgi:DNA-directed RNA polymerase II subunit RPB2
MDYYKDTWYVIDDYFKSNKYFITNHHIDSWNDFVTNKLINTIQVLNPFIVLKNQDENKVAHEIQVFVGNEQGKEIFINKPTILENGSSRILYPNEARLRDLTYQSELYANILVKYITRNTQTGEEKVDEDYFKNIKIGALPIMLHSKLCVLHDQPPNVLREMGECPFEQGGYFVVDGKEKVIVAQERIALNRLFINKSKSDKYSYEGLVRCTSDDNPLFPKTFHIYVTKDSTDTPDEIRKKKKRVPNSISIVCPNVKDEIPIFILFRALGVESDKDILEHILYDVERDQAAPMMEFLRYSLIDAAGKGVMTQEDAIQFLANRVEYNNVNKVKHVLTHDLFPNVGYKLRNKALFLGHIINRLTKVCLEILPESDRDNYIYKRVDISGFLMGNLFRDYYNQFRNTVKNNIDRQYLFGPWRSTLDIKNLINKTNINLIFRSYIIENGMQKSLKGRWGKTMLEDVPQDADDIKEGLVQDLARISYMGFISHLRRVNTPIDPTSKIVAPHRLHSSQWGIMCPVESPDGGSIGLLKNFAIMCHVTFDIPTHAILKVLRKLDVVLLDNVSVSEISIGCKVSINSTWIGMHFDPPSLFKILKLLKRNGFINTYASVSWNIVNNEINVSTEAGRCCRPVYVVEDSKLLIEKYLQDVKAGKLSWFDLINGGLHAKVSGLEDPMSFFKDDKIDLALLEASQAPIEYIDVEETNYSLIAMDKKTITKHHTHCELHPSTIFSVVSHNIPLANHNQAPRNVFFGAQGKQAVGVYTSNFKNRIDTMSYVLHYPQRSLVNTRYMDYLHNNKLPHGENLIVAIATYTGYNQEDSIIINKSSIEKGMFNMTYFKNIIQKEDENKRDNEVITFKNPLRVIEEGQEIQNLKFANYKKALDEHGLPRENVYISENDAIVGKSLVKTEYAEDTTTNNIFGNKIKKNTYYDKSLIADKTMSGIIDKVFVYFDSENKKTCKVRFRKVRKPELGDKMSSRHGQKGVVGMILPQENMPFNEDGIVPDIIINPHAFPTRMTIGHLLESILAKTCVKKGFYVDGTPFNNNDYESIFKMLETDFGMDRHGNEILYNGFTGEQIHTEIFFGPTYYMRLKHMVADKINYRRDGPITAVTRQPTKGRGNNGGLRIGEMEKDSILSHGMSAFLKESLMERSDIYGFEVDNKEGYISATSKHTSDDTDFSKVKTPYAFKLLLQEIVAMGVKPILNTKGSFEDDDYTDDAEVAPILEGDEEENNVEGSA